MLQITGYNGQDLDECRYEQQDPTSKRYELQDCWTWRATGATTAIETYTAGYKSKNGH